MTRRKNVFLMVVSVLAALGFLVGGVILFRTDSNDYINSSAADAAADTDTYNTYLKDKFGYIRPGGEEGGNGKLGADYFGQSGNESVRFNLYTTNVYNDTANTLPVFSVSDMQKIAEGTGQSSAGVEDAFVMVKPGEFLVMEFSNFMNRGNLEAWHDDTKFTTISDTMYPAQFSMVNMANQSDDYLKNFTDARHNVIAHNATFSLRGIFSAEGYYKFRFVLALDGGWGNNFRVFEFGFYLVKAEQYKLHDTESSFNPSPSPDDAARGMLLMQNTRMQVAEADVNSYFFNYGDEEFPYLHYDNKRFKVDVLFEDYQGVIREGHKDSPVDENGEWTTRLTKREFNQLGTYTISISLGAYRKQWNDESEEAHGGFFAEANNWTVYKITLTNFGFQAQYFDHEANAEAWLGGAGEDEDYYGTSYGKSSDISSRFTNNYTVNPAYMSEQPSPNNSDSAIDEVSDSLGGLKPAVTNSSYVQLRYNVPHLFTKDGQSAERTQMLSRVAYLAPDGIVWDTTSRKYVIGQPFEDAGTYAVLVYYTYPAATNYQKGSDGEDYTYFQVFYFQIKNIAADVALAVEGNPKTYTYEEILRSGVYSAGITLYSVSASHDGEPLSPYEKQPQYWLTYYRFGEDNPAEGFPKNISNTINALEPALYYKDGTYVFNVRFGNTLPDGQAVSGSEFTVIVDTSLIDADTYAAASTNPGSEYDAGIKNVSVFGGGSVSLQWGAKASGIGMKEVLHAHYPVAWESYVDGQSTGAGNIKSGWVLGDVETYLESGSAPDKIYRDPVTGELTPSSIGCSQTSDGNGWKLNDPLNGAGLHLLIIIDEAGNKNIYIIIIDATSAGFAQNPFIPSEYVGGVKTYKMNVFNQRVTVGMGLNKVVPFSNVFNSPLGAANPTKTPMSEFLEIIGEDLANQLKDSKLLQTEGTEYGYVIPVKQAEVSTDNKVWAVLEDETKVFDKNNNNALLLTATKNTNEYYAVMEESLSSRRDFFFKVEDETGNTGWHYVQINPDLSQGMIFEDGSSAVPADGSLPSPSSGLYEAGIVQDAGVSNGKFLTFSLLQRTIGNEIVNKVDVYFYPFKYDPALNNYPFSDTPDRYKYYQSGYPDEDNLGLRNLTGRIYIPLIGDGTKTMRGLYAIRREYAGSTDKIRWYYVIADDNPIILPGGKDEFETGVTIDFGDKTAEDADFKRLDLIESNTQGNINIPVNGKYYNAEIGKPANTFKIVHDNGLIDKTFTALNLNLNVERLENGVYVSEGGTTRLGDGRYRINLTDGAGGFLWNITKFEAKWTPPNASVINADIKIAGPRGEFWFNNTRVNESAYIHDDSKNTHFYSVRLAKGLSDKLVFEFHNDSEEFLSEITSVELKRNGAVIPFGEEVQFNQNRNQEGRYEYSIVLGDEDNLYTPIWGKDVFSVKLTSSVGTSVFECVIDDTPARYNRKRVQDADNFISAYAGGIDVNSNAANYDNYPFAISNSFVFEYASEEHIKEYNSNAGYNPFIDTCRAYWTPVDNSLFDAGTAQPLPYYRRGDANAKTFAEIVGLKPTENRFFKITEWDEAEVKWNVGDDEPWVKEPTPTVYFVQLRGSEYRDTVTLGSEIRTDREGQSEAGLTVPTNNLFNRSRTEVSYRDTYGIDMKIADAYAFYNNNLFFEIKIGNEYVRRFGKVISFGVSGLDKVGGKQSGSEFTGAEFAEILQAMLDNILNGTAVTTVKNRFNTAEEFTFDLYHISASVPLPRVVDDAPMIAVDVNVEGMPSIFTDDNGLNWTFEVYDRMPVDGKIPPDWAAKPPSVEENMNAIQLPNSDGEYLIVITDKFGRRLFHEHNGIYSSDVKFNYNATAKVVKGDLYIGDADGVTVTYSPEIYDILFYGNNVLVNGMPSGARSTVEGNITHVRLSPGTNDTTNWKIVAVRKGLSTMNPNYIATIFECNFYSWLPDVEAANLSLEPIEGLLNGGRTTGVVVVKYSNEGRIFNAQVSYRRTYEDPNNPGEMITDRVVMRRSTSSFNLMQAGIYKIEVMNDVWAAAEYNFEITDVSNTGYKVFSVTAGENDTYIEKELLASPVLYDWRETPIPIYWVTGNNRSDIAINSSGSNAAENNDCKIKIVISPNMPREIMGRIGSADVKNTVYEWVVEHSYIVIYRLRSKTDPHHEFYFAVGYVPESNLSDSNVRQNIADINSTEHSVTTSQSPQYRIYTHLSAEGITYSLAQGSNAYPTNVTYVDYWRNDVYCGRLIGTESLTIHSSDYGIYEFHIYDWAGNVKKFTDTTATATSGTYNHFTLINLSSGPVRINGETIVDGMVFNDKMELSTWDIPYDKTSQNYAYISELIYTRDGVPGEYYSAAEKTEERQSFTYTTPGLYKFSIKYKIEIGAEVLDMPGTYTVYLLSSDVGRQGFSYGPYPGIEIVGVTQNGMNIRRNWPEKHLYSIDLNSTQGNIYVVTIEIADDGIRPAFTREFVVVINNLPTPPKIITTLVDGSSNDVFGSSTTGTVRLVPSEIIPDFYGDTVIVIERNFEHYERIPISRYETIDFNDSRLTINSAENPKDGVFEVRLESPNGGIFFSDVFQIGTSLNFLSVIVILIFVAAAVIAVLAFIIIRTKMRAK